MTNKTQIKAVLFDCDGVLLDSEREIKLHVHKFMVENYNCSMEYEYFYTNTRGCSLKKTLEFLKTHNINYCDKLFTKFESFFLDDYHKHTTKMANIEETLNTLSHLPKAVCSNGITKYYAKALEVHNIKNHFNGFFGMDNVENVKPSPDMFLKAAEHLKIDIKNCLIIDDSFLTGIPAGKSSNAGAVVGFLSDEFSSEIDMLNAGADYVISNLNELPNLINKINNEVE